MSLVIDWQRWVLAPPRRIKPGADWQGRGPDYTLRTLAQNLVRRGGHILRGAAATTLLERNGACAGVEIRVGDASQYIYSRAVILADGGFQGNLELLRRHICAAPEKLMQRGASTGLGDGLRMARDFGAQLSDLEHFYGHVLSRDAFHNPKTWPYPQLDELGVAGLVVGPDARRFTDEGLGGVSLANAIARLPDPLSAWAIFDSAIWETAGRSARIPANPHLANAGGTILKSESLQDLASQAGLPAPALQATVAAYRQAIIDNAPHQLTPPRTVSTRRPWPIDCPPYYATPICAGITYTMGGILIDEHSRVRSPNGAPIAGLYAAGATTAGLEGRASPTYVGGLMKGLVFGLRAAEHVALTFIRQPSTLTLNG